MSDIYPDIAFALDRLSLPTERSDWEDVLARARENGRIQHAIAPRAPARRRRRVALALAALLLVFGILVATPAFGLRAKLVSLFADAEPAPARIVSRFEEDELATATELGSKLVESGVIAGTEVIAEQARKVLETSFHGGLTAVLYVAPTRTGSFCFELETKGPGEPPERSFGSCGRAGLTISTGFAALLSRDHDRDGVVLVGRVEDANVESVAIVFPDGSAELAPYVWVTEPIDEGFFLYALPEVRLRPGRLPEAVVGRGADGQEVARDAGIAGALAEDCPVPCGAIAAEKRKLIEVVTSSGAEVAFWIAPSPDGDRCQWMTYRGNLIYEQCAPPVAAPRSVGGGPWQLRDDVVVFGFTGSQVESVELRYEDGDRSVVRPVEGVILAPIAPEHFERGRRLSLLVGRDFARDVVAEHRIETNTPGAYPCEKPELVGTHRDGTAAYVCP